ncbi:MAG: GDYXXLXY domain-containing protein [Thiopseudomonas sp.]
MRKTGIFLVFLLLLAGINFSIWRTEQVLENGQEVILQLAPVDPRSLMQGDYMALRFALGEEVRGLLRQQLAANVPGGPAGTADIGDWLPALSGTLLVQLDDQGIARLVSLDGEQPATEGQLRLHYRLRHGTVQFATNGFFFQEGTAKQYEAARYGLFRVSGQGQPYLTHLLDEKLEKIGQTAVLQN